jgi:hypothetical protein
MNIKISKLRIVIDLLISFRNCLSIIVDLFKPQDVKPPDVDKCGQSPDFILIKLSMCNLCFELVSYL